MKKADCLSYGVAVLLTVAFFGIFFMGADGIAQINNIVCNNYQDYSCNYTYSTEGVTLDNGTDCLTICYDDNFEVDVYGDCFDCYLYPATGSKYLLGTADTCGGWAGCSVEFKGRSIITKVAFIEYGSTTPGLEVISRCTPCNNCCSIVPSDRRLKKFINEVKGIYNQIGLNMYIWQWNKKAERMFGLKGYSAGVIAQEVKEKYPDAVVEYKGYLKVRYGYLDRLLLMQGS